MIREPPFLEYLYSNEFLLSDVNTEISSASVSSINKYIDLLRSVHISMFSALQVILVGIVLYFICSLFNQMKKDMLSSHTMIAMLPKHLLQRKD